ncbi:NTP pyrophosphohydrolase [Streptomyces sp. NPDC088261]|uniref:NTP pyrophosphohydrolase n=1 Tax=Streptomyces sp. NPDC088261 TaxID=3365851 RepID=UPI00381F11E2
MRILLVVDAANVVGSVPDGWWRDRRGANERLRDALVPYGERGVAGHPGPVETVLVVEGAARGVESVPRVRVEPAPGSGDDRIVELAAEAAAAGRGCVVATADRELRRRVTAYGASCVGPSAVRQRLGDDPSERGDGTPEAGDGT